MLVDIPGKSFGFRKAWHFYSDQAEVFEVNPKGAEAVFTPNELGLVLIPTPEEILQIHQYKKAVDIMGELLERHRVDHGRRKEGGETSSP